MNGFLHKNIIILYRYRCKFPEVIIEENAKFDNKFHVYLYDKAKVE